MYVDLDHVSKTIKGKAVLRDVSVGFERGRIYGVVGPNGSGKTMLLRAICGFIRLDAGTVTINGETVEFNRKLPDSVGVIIENPRFVLQETVIIASHHSDELNQIADHIYTMREGMLSVDD